MIDITQILLILVVVVLTVLLCVIGVQVYFLLKEVKKSIDKLNHFLDNAEEITENIGKPIAGLTGILAGVREGFKLFKVVRGKSSKE